MSKYRTSERLDESQVADPVNAWRGVNNRVPVDKLPPGLVADGLNTRMRNGDIEARLGVVKPGWLNRVTPGDNRIYPGGDTLYGVGVFKDPSRVEWTFTAADGFIYRHRPNNTRTALTLPAGVKILSDCSFAQAFNRMFCFRGRHLQPLVLSDLETGFEDLLPRWGSAAAYDAAILALEREADEIAYGPFQSILSMTSVGDLVTVVTPAEHGFVTGADVTITGAVQTEYNGRFNITVLDANTFTYQFAGSATSPANQVTLVSLTHVGTTATGTKVAHGYVTGQTLLIAGATPAEYNGEFVITVTGANTFTYVMASNPGANATGTLLATLLTMQCSNMALYWQALGSRVTLTSLTRAGTTATATKTAHGFTTGQYVAISGVTPAAFNGTYVITVTGADTFTYVMAIDPGSNGAGTMLARTSVVLAGQSPDTNPEAWQPLYNILPNADDALSVGLRLLVPTAYTPGAAGYDSSSSYTKKDYIVATDVLDPIHFDFTNEFRINEGDDSEIVALCKYDNNNVIVCKGRCWGILSNIRLDISQVTFDLRTGYGTCALRAAIAAGLNVYFPVTQRGVTGLNQTVQGLVQSTDVALSNDIEAWIKRITWTYAHKIRMAWWDDKLYVAVPMDGASLTQADHLEITGSASVISGTWITQNVGVTDGGYSRVHPSIPMDGTYWWNPKDAVEISALAQLAVNPIRFIPAAPVRTSSGLFSNLAGNDPWVWAPNGTTGTMTSELFAVSEIPERTLSGVNNAILVYDFRTGQWVSCDTGEALCVKEFFTATYLGKERLFFIGEDGWVNLLEESPAGDQVAGGTTETLGGNNLSYQEITMSATLGGNLFGEIGPKRFPMVEFCLEVWNAKFSISAGTGAAHTSRAVLTDKEFSRVKYLKPFDKPDWEPDNNNGDFNQPNRGNYSVALTAAGVYPEAFGDVINLAQHQEIFFRCSTKTLTGQYPTVELTNTQGRMRIKSVSPVAAPGARRMGVLI